MSYISQFHRLPNNLEFVKDIINRLARVQADQNRGESDDTDFIRLLRLDADLLVFTDAPMDMVSDDHGVQARTKQFNLSFEPDGEITTLLMPFDAYAFEGHVEDRSGFKNHGSVAMGDPDPRLGKMGGSMQFNGESDIVGIPDSTSLQMKGTLGFSFSCWFLPKTISFLGTANEPVARRIACKTDDMFNGWAIGITAFKYVVFAIKSTSTGGNYQWVMTPPNITALNIWYHLVVTYNNTSPPIPRIYLNNVASTTRSEFTITANNELEPRLLFGGRDASLPGGNNAWFWGRIDHAIFYRNKILTPGEINNLYTQGYSLTTPPVARVGHAYLTKNPGFDPIGYDAIGYDTTG